MAQPEKKFSLANPPFTPDHWQAIAAAMKLSRREAEVAELKIRGAQLKEIAAILEIEICTVRGFQNRIYAKAGIRRHEFMAHLLSVSHQIRCGCPQK